jgi:ribA/ribD-fused uncharacterized protein
MKDELKGEFNSSIKVLEDKITESVDYAIAKADEAAKSASKSESVNKKLKDGIDQLWKAVNDLKLENATLKSKLTRLESHSKKSNLLFGGFPETGAKETEEDCRSKVLQILEFIGIPNHETIVIPRCHRLGKYTPGGKRPIVAFFQSFNDRKAIWSLRYELKNSDKKWFIGEHHPVEIERRRKKLYPIKAAALKLAHYKGKVSLYEDKLYINNVMFTPETLDRLPADINPKKLSEKRDGEVVAFFTKYSPLSNFYHCDLRFEGEDYVDLEQALSYAKCKLFDDTRAIQKVMSTADPAEQKSLAADTRIEGFQKRIWEDKRDDIMKAALRAKFVQNKHLGDYLLKTGDRILAEASPKDTYWGIGVRLSDPNVLDKASWTGSNNLGQFLMEIREELKTHCESYSPQYAISTLGQEHDMSTSDMSSDTVVVT